MITAGSGPQLAFFNRLLHNVAQLPDLTGSLQINPNLDLDSTEL